MSREQLAIELGDVLLQNTLKHVEELKAERDALKADAERKSIAGAQLFHDMQAEVERIDTARREVLQDNAELQSENEQLKAKVQADADVVAICEHLLEENRSEAELVAELRELREAASRVARRPSLVDDSGEVLFQAMAEHRAAMEALRAVLAKGGV